ncbi:MAG: ATP-binding protein [Lewinellaceae bacterium]|nr:ATP-binding protein [Lewinellaceae bacterium]
MQVSQQYTFKIVTTGPESSGKSIMAEALAQHFKTSWAPEFARSYLNHLGRPYTRIDLAGIAKGQQSWEQWYAQQGNDLYFCDTDWTVLQVWEHFRFGLPENGNWVWATGYAHPQPANWYFLCAPDFPWQADPLRENPYQREILFDWYEDILNERSGGYTVLRGPHDKRLEQAISQVTKLFTPLR